jgi:hypothetical protein
VDLDRAHWGACSFEDERHGLEYRGRLRWSGPGLSRSLCRSFEQGGVQLDEVAEFAPRKRTLSPPPPPLAARTAPGQRKSAHTFVPGRPSARRRRAASPRGGVLFLSSLLDPGVVTTLCAPEASGEPQGRGAFPLQPARAPCRSIVSAPDGEERPPWGEGCFSSPTFCFAAGCLPSARPSVRADPGEGCFSSPAPSVAAGLSTVRARDPEPRRGRGCFSSCGGYLPFQLGWRFSRKAQMPSWASAAIEFMTMTDLVRSYAWCSSSSTCP